MPASGVVPELAYYYGDKQWFDSPDYFGSKRWFDTRGLIDWTKSLLLFFDGVATSYPAGEFDRLVNSDPILATPLAERGLLANYEPAEQPTPPEFFDPATGHLTAEAREIIKVIEPFFEAISERSQATSMPTQSALDSVRTALEADRLRCATTGAMIQPITDEEPMAEIVSYFVKAYAHASKSQVIAADLKNIGVEFSTIPLDEVLDFRAQNGAAYRSYARELRSFTLHLSLMGEYDQTISMRERAQDLEDMAADLRTLARRAYTRAGISLMFGIAGAAWTLSMGDPWGAVFAAGASIAASGVSDPIPAGSAYSYILRTRDELRRS